MAKGEDHTLRMAIYDEHHLLSTHSRTLTLHVKHEWMIRCFTNGQIEATLDEEVRRLMQALGDSKGV